MPSIDAHDDNVIDCLMALERFESVDEHGLVIDIDELLGDILPHACS